MNFDELKKLCILATVKPAALAQLRPEHTPRAFFDLLLEQRDYSNGIRLFPHLLPARVAVWWGCQCVWSVFAPTPPNDLVRTLQKVVRWVVDPSEANRLALGPLEPYEAMWTTPGCLAVAVLWSGGSLAAPEWPAIPPPEYGTPRAVAGAVMRAAVEREPMEYMEHYRHFLDLGMHLVARRNLWVPAPAVAVEPRFDEAMAPLAASR